MYEQIIFSSVKISERPPFGKELLTRLTLCSLFVLSNCNLSLVMRKPDFCVCENKDADQLRGNRETDQRICFRYADSTIPLLFKSEISSL